MKKFLLLMVSLLAFYFGKTQMHNALPPEAKEFYGSAIQKIKPAIVSYISKTAKELAGQNVDGDSLYYSIKKDKALKNVSPEDCKTISLLVLIKCSLDADAELKQKVLNIQKKSESDMSYDETAPLLKRKSDLAAQVSAMIRNVRDENSVLRNLQ